MGKIYIVGLGPGSVDDLTKGAIERIEAGSRNYLRTENHPTVKYFHQRDIKYESFDEIYEAADSFKDVYETIADRLEELSKDGDLNYFVPGNPLVAESSVKNLLERDLDIELVAGLSFLEPVMGLVKKDPVDGFMLLDALDLRISQFNLNKDIIITQVHNSLILSELKLILSEVYGDYHQVYFIKNAGIKGEEVCVKGAIYELDRDNEPNLLTSIYVPRMEEKHGFENLIDIMELLRSEEGCPWDIEQDHMSIRESVIEEAYELVYAIEKDDTENIIEELGDVLLQVIFHSQIAREEGSFNIYDVLNILGEKLIYRHPHVFSDKNIAKSEEIVYNWDILKFQKRGVENYTDRLKGVKGLPALLTSYKIQKEAAKVGFDWDNVDGPIDKIKEEFEEVLVSMEEGNIDSMEEEIGDLLFSIVNLSRFIEVNPEIAINRTINKFISRFEIMESISIKKGIDLKDLDLDSLDKLWIKAKEELKD